jgi:23S rRNA (uracil1939-C5)-methyltransferase
MQEASQPIRITKLVPGGQGLGELPDGKKAFVWNALPGEDVLARVFKQRASYVEAIAEEIERPAPERVAPREVNYLATSPWQILAFDAENRYKKNIAEGILKQHDITVPAVNGTAHDDREWHYRNKMEYSFWGDDTGLHAALHRRGSHGKQSVTGSVLAMPPVDVGTDSIRILLEKAHVRAGELKTIIVRSTQEGTAAASLFVKSEAFQPLELPPALQGLRVYYSNPKSPASVRTRLLYELGSSELADTLLGRIFRYDVDSFFQVNVPVFELALQRIKEKFANEELVDMYAGVGSIGLSVASRKVDLVELDAASAAMAQRNTETAGVRGFVVKASAEQTLQHIVANKPIIVDPPRAGLHEKIISRILEVRPPRIAYLSCNPVTQARDIVLLRDAYRVSYFEVFNFFPHTPHIETLAILERS